MGEAYDSIPRVVFNALSARDTTSTFSADPPDGHSNEDESNGFNQWFRTMTSTTSNRATPDDGKSAPRTATGPSPAEEEEDGRARLLSSLGQKPAALAFATRCAGRLAGRRGVFFSRDGGHVGSGPPATAEGDALFVLDGVDAPMILRPAEDAGRSGSSEQKPHYTVLGPAFVYGFTDLEGFDLADHGGDWLSIVLT